MLSKYKCCALPLSYKGYHPLNEGSAVIFELSAKEGPKINLFVCFSGSFLLQKLGGFAPPAQPNEKSTDSNTVQTHMM